MVTYTEAGNRASGKVVDMEDYHYVRRENIGLPARFAIFEPALGINLPDAVERPAFKEISTIGIGLICWSNVRYSTPKPGRTSQVWAGDRWTMNKYINAIGV